MFVLHLINSYTDGRRKIVRNLGEQLALGMPYLSPLVIETKTDMFGFAYTTERRKP